MMDHRLHKLIIKGETMKEFLGNVKKDPKTYLTLAIAILIVVGAIFVLLSVSADNWREMYCQANPINCIRKGW
jgi:hypothetical protein